MSTQSRREAFSKTHTVKRANMYRVKIVWENEKYAALFSLQHSNSYSLSYCVDLYGAVHHCKVRQMSCTEKNKHTHTQICSKHTEHTLHSNKSAKNKKYFKKIYAKTISQGSKLPVYLPQVSMKSCTHSPQLTLLQESSLYHTGIEPWCLWVWKPMVQPLDNPAALHVNEVAVECHLVQLMCHICINK